MHDVTLIIDEDVSVVAVLHIEQVREDRVSRQALDEVSLCCLVVVSEVLPVKSCEGPFFVWKLLLQVVDRVCVGDEL